MPHSRIAIYPGSFDPITYGHLDIIQRGLKIFKHVIVAVARNSQKNALFNIDERVELIRTVLKDEPRVSVDTFTGLLIDYVASKKAHVVIRGLRAISDFEYEFQIAQMNSTIGHDYRNPVYDDLSSVRLSFIINCQRGLLTWGAVDSFVPPEVKTPCSRNTV
jgi:pantetheine-phosphate adenylyltransferase